MKITMECECTPEEARSFLGLPDVTRANEIYVDALANAMQGKGGFEHMQEMLKQVAPMGQFGLKLFQQLMDTGTAKGAPAAGNPRKNEH